MSENYTLLGILKYVVQWVFQSIKNVLMISIVILFVGSLLLNIFYMKGGITYTTQINNYTASNSSSSSVVVNTLMSMGKIHWEVKQVSSFDAVRNIADGLSFSQRMFSKEGHYHQFIFLTRWYIEYPIFDSEK